MNSQDEKKGIWVTFLRVPNAVCISSFRFQASSAAAEAFTNILANRLTKSF
jgi:hypothetical protein